MLQPANWSVNGNCHQGGLTLLMRTLSEDSSEADEYEESILLEQGADFCPSCKVCVDMRHIKRLI